MKFSDLPNPEITRKLFQQVKRRFSEKVCLSPFRDCQGAIVSAHT
jgi:hypothetical protein